MAFYPAKGGNENLSLCYTSTISMSIPANGDTVINVKDYDSDAKIATGIKIVVPAVTNVAWGGNATHIRGAVTVKASGGSEGTITFDGTNIHVKRLPSVAESASSVTTKLTCTLIIGYVK